MDDDKKRLALFKFSLIAPVVNGLFDEPSKMAYFRKLAKTERTLPDGRVVSYSEHTYKHWYNDYMHGGFEGLLQDDRRDKGHFRRLTDTLTEAIVQLKQDYPRMNASEVYRRLVDTGICTRNDISLSTVQRFVRTLEPVEGKVTEARKPFEMEHINQLWQADTWEIGYWPDPELKRKTRLFLMCILDDASRLPMQVDIVRHDDAITFQDVLKKALKKFGIPSILYVDNGAPYANKQLELILASLGIQLIHTRVRIPQGKGKQERIFRTFRDQWRDTISLSSFASLQAMQADFHQYLTKRYERTPRSALNGQSPLERYHAELDLIRHRPSEWIDEQFLHREQRRVRQDATIQFQNRLFEVPAELCGQTVEIHYPPLNPDICYLVMKDKGTMRLRLTDKVLNASVKRQTIDYSEPRGV